MRRTPAATISIALILGLSACSSSPRPGPAAATFAAGWSSGSFGARLHFVDSNGAALTGAQVSQQITTMSGDLSKIHPRVTAGKAKVTKSAATVPLTVAWPIATGITWTYRSTLRLRLSNDTWRVVWSPAVFAPQMSAGQSLRVRTSQPPRADILDASGQPIVTSRPVEDVGVEPSLVTNITSLVAALNKALKPVAPDTDLSDLPARVKAAAPHAFVYVTTLREPVYQQVRPQIHDLPGTVFRSYQLPLAPTRIFARALLGSVGDVTKERMDKHPGAYVVGDLVGFDGLQERYDDRLRGTDGVTVVIAGTAGSQETELFHADPNPGQPLKITLDQRVQTAADEALANQKNPAAIVAIRISDGAILADANGPASEDLDLGLTAQVPPGSMFKTVTATGLLQAGKVTPSTPINCPATLTVNGRQFHNAESEALGTVPLVTDFAKSCNTAFASLAPRLGPTGLRDAASQLGIGVPWQLGIDAFTGKVSANGDPAEQAAAAFGQGTTVVSPVAMAAAAAAIARGQWKQPTLVLDPTVTPVADQAPLKPSTVDALHLMMRAVVTSGTGTGVAHVPGGPVYGKTGTAEYGDNTHSHSWFMGFQGDIAFAVFVQNGGFSFRTAVPLAGAFLTALSQS